MDPTRIPLVFYAVDWVDVFMGWLGIGDGRWDPYPGDEE